MTYFIVKHKTESAFITNVVMKWKYGVRLSLT